MGTMRPQYNRSLNWQIPQVEMQSRMQVFSTRNEKKTHLFDPRNSRLSQWGAAMQASLGSMTSSIQGRKTRRIKSRHVCITWILWPTNVPKLPQNHVDTWNHHKDPPDNHHDKAQGEGPHHGVSQPHRLDEPTLRRFILAVHVVLPD
jgi:hypothetical protein